MTIRMVAALLGAAALQAQQGWEVTGTVSYNSKPLHEVWVRIDGGQRRIAATTDRQGRYVLKGTEPGTFTISVQKGDNSAEMRPRTLSLAPGMRLQVDFAFPKGGVLSGRVLDAEKQPLAGQIVMAYAKTLANGQVRLNGVNGDKTNDLGEYRIANLPDGDYVIATFGPRNKIRPKSVQHAASPKAYPQFTFYPSGRTVLGAAAVNVRSASEETRLDITMQKEPTHCISFRAGGVFVSPPNSSHNSSDATLDERIGAELTGDSMNLTRE